MIGMALPTNLHSSVLGRFSHHCVNDGGFTLVDHKDEGTAFPSESDSRFSLSGTLAPGGILNSAAAADVCHLTSLGVSWEV